MSGSWTELKNYMSERFPFWKPTLNLVEVPDELVSLKQVPISHKAFDRCKAAVKAFHELRENKTYQEKVMARSDSVGNVDPGNYSILMSFDFHVSEDDVRLIEINTNAAFATLIWGLSEKDNVDLPGVSEKFDRSLKQAIMNEAKALNINHLDLRIAIMDERPEEQNAFFEFLLYRELFENWGWDTVICDPSELAWDENAKELRHDQFGKVNFVYNRNCDFLFEEVENRHLAEAFSSKKVCFSPNPHEYNLLAHKERLIELSDHNFLSTLNLSPESESIIKEVVLNSFTVTSRPKDELWEMRKTLFFKPKQSYGSKAVYRGKSITRKALDTIYSDEFLAQEYFPPAKHEGFKYDLRLYTYKDEIQLCAARLYQGQVTNVRSLGGGLATLRLR